jgi:hypothetical protein
MPFIHFKRNVYLQNLVYRNYNIYKQMSKWIKSFINLILKEFETVIHSEQGTANHSPVSILLSEEGFFFCYLHEFQNIYNNAS